jgi:bifunctional non-homologous end joining protein LigD
MTRKSKAREGARPAYVEAMAAQLVDRLPAGPEWLYELKLDGYRALILKTRDDVQIRSRNDRGLTRTYPGIAAAAGKVPADLVAIDGEIVALDEKGRPSFQALQNRAALPAGTNLVFYAFDVLHLDGRDLKSERLEDRRARLPALISGTGLLLSRDLPGEPGDIVASVRALGLEGVMAKRRDSVYEPGERSGAWVKVKVELQQEFVVGGYRPSGQSIDALIVGYYDGEALRYGGKVRAGFVPHTRREVFRQLQGIKAAPCPFVDLPTGRSRWGGGITADEMREMQWTRPEAVAQIAFVEWTADGRLRHARFLGLRSDKSAREVHRETPAPVENPEQLRAPKGRKPSKRR